jgi:sigma-B regulation protein RsbU (phosphoserine phosphatase)
MASLAFFVGGMYLWSFYFRRQREELFFSLSCFSIAYYDISAAGLYNSHMIEEAICWQMNQYISLGLLSITILWFVYYYAVFLTGRKSIRNTMQVFTAYVGIMLIVGIVTGNETTLSPEMMVNRTLKIGDMVMAAFVQARIGFLYRLQYVVLLIIFAWILYLIVREYRRGNRMLLSIMLALVFFFLAAIHDFLVVSGYISSIYLMEFMYITLILAMSYILLNRFMTLHYQVAAVNRELEEKVEERTRDLNLTLNVLRENNQYLEKRGREQERDLNLAIQVQKHILPRQSPSCHMWDLDFFFSPMKGLSGDFYDFYVEEGKLKGVALFDVSGHGIASGMITMLARSIAFRTFSRSPFTPLEEIMKRINRDLKEEMGDVEQYLSGILVRLGEEGRVEYVNAGHPDLLLRRASDGSVTRIGKDITMEGVLLGLTGIDGEFSSYSFTMEKDDVLLLYTDGLWQNLSGPGNPYPYGELMGILASSGTGDSAGILLNILKGCQPGEPAGDDATCIVLRKK